MMEGPKSAPEDVRRVRRGDVGVFRCRRAFDELGGQRRPPLVVGLPNTKNGRALPSRPEL